MKGGSLYGGRGSERSAHGHYEGAFENPNNNSGRSSNRRPRGGAVNNSVRYQHGNRGPGQDHQYGDVNQKFHNMSVTGEYYQTQHRENGSDGNKNYNEWNHQQFQRNNNKYVNNGNAKHNTNGNFSFQNSNNGQHQANNSTDNKGFNNLPSEFSPGEGLPRRPFLHIVVLFASDPRVMAYAENVAKKFLDAGIDVWLMTELSKQDKDASYILGNRPARWIKPEHLVSIITSSKSDSLIVLGDRNMKNETCQERKSGKLVEVSLNDSIDSLLQYWAHQTGLRYFKPLQNCFINGKDASSEEQVFDCVRELTGTCGHAINRLERIREITEELAEWKRHTQKLAVAASNTSAASVKLTDFWKDKD